VAGEDDLHLRAELDDAVSATADKIEAKLAALGDTAEHVGDQGREMGAGMEEGSDRAERGLDGQTRATTKTREETDKLGESTKRTRQESDKSTSSWARYEKQMKKTAKATGGFKFILMGFKFGSILAGGYALVGLLSALGAAAVIAVAGLGPMLSGLASFAPVAVSAMIGLKLFKLGLEAAQPEADALKSKFDKLGESVAAGGLRSGIVDLTKRVGPLVDRLDTGFRLIGGSLGEAARQAGAFVNNTLVLDQISQSLAGISQIISLLTPGVFNFGGGLLALFTASLPAGYELAELISGIGESFNVWAQRVTASGQAQQFFLDGLHALQRAVGVLMDWLVGLWNVLKIASEFAGEFGLGLENGARRWREWTGSVEGQNAIRQWFTDAMPAIRETFLILRDLFHLFGDMSTQPGLAPLLAQIRTELLPAIATLLHSMTGSGGLLESVITMATAFATFLTTVDPGAFMLIAQALAGIVNGIAWIAQNVPGAGTAISMLATGFLLIGPAAKILGFAAGNMAKLSAGFKWVKLAHEGAGKLTLMQRAIGPILRGVTSLASGFMKLGPVVKIVGTVTSWVSRLGGIISNLALRLLPWLARAISLAFVATPVGWIVAAIGIVIGIVMLLWNKCEWFRNAVLAVWAWIKDAALACWEGILAAVSWVVSAAIAVWDALKIAWQAVVDFIVMVGMYIWEHGLKQTIQFLVTGFQIGWAIISWIVQVAVYVIVGIMIVLLTIAKTIWEGIAAAAVAVWTYVILPVIQFVVSVVTFLFQAWVAFFVWVWSMISTAAIWCWQNVILPAIMFVANAAMAIWNPIATFFAWLWGIIQTGAQIAWLAIQVMLGIAANAAMAVWSPIAGFFSGLWSGISSAARACWDGISSAASSVAGVVKGVWDGVVGVVKSAYNAIANGWNSIPDITVPDWVPGMGGQTFGLPKLPTLWHGGTVQYDTALVGEHGPEPLLSATGRMLGMLGAHGPEIATGLPRGGYVVPNLDTFARFPGLMHKLPASVGSAVSAAVPGYAEMLSGGSGGSSTPPPPPSPRDDSGNRALARSIDRLAHAVSERPPPISATGGDVEEQVWRALRRWEQRKKLRERYSYGGAG
jgi:hypothetical protein